MRLQYNSEDGNFVAHSQEELPTVSKNGRGKCSTGNFCFPTTNTYPAESKLSSQTSTGSGSSRLNGFDFIFRPHRSSTYV